MESVSLLRFVLACSTVLALLGLLALALRYIASRGCGIAPQGRNRRLKIVETLPLDTRRRLVIVQCDDAEHLLLLGTQQDRVIATNLPLPPPPAPTP